MSWDFLFVSFSLLEEVIDRMWLPTDLYELDLSLLIHFLNNYFDGKKFLILKKPKLFFFLLWLVFCDLPTEDLPSLRSQSYSVFSSGTFVVLVFIFSSMNHQKLCFNSWNVSSLFFPYKYSISWHCLLKNLSCLHPTHLILWLESIYSISELIWSSLSFFD